YSQLFNFHYADGKMMLTVGGIFADQGDAALVAPTFSDLDFVRRGARPYRIETPILTMRELRFLDSLLPADRLNSQPKWIPGAERRKYRKLYRHFPSYGVVES